MNNTNECLWMKTKTIKKHYCDNSFNCFDCNFNQSMEKGVKMKKINSWKEVARKTEKQPCRYSLTGLIPNRSCCINFNCDKCEFHQINQDAYFNEISNLQSELINA